MHPLLWRSRKNHYFCSQFVAELLEDAEESGAGMIGTTQMMSSTLYRFATVNVEALAANLGNEQLARVATQQFVEAFIQSMPTGKQNTFANNTLPELVYVTVRDTRSVSLVTAFEDPVVPEPGENRVVALTKAMVEEARGIEDAYGLKPKAAFVLSTKQGLAEAFAGLAASVNARELKEQLAQALNAEGE